MKVIINKNLNNFMLRKIGNIICETDKRTALVRKNIFVSFFIKGWAALMQLLLVPLTLNCLGVYKNGVWLTISSMLLWIDNMDIGLGNGLRNKLAESLAVGDYGRARKIVSSTFAMLIFIIVPVVVLLNVLVYCSDVYSLLNVDKSQVDDLSGVIAISILFVGVTFVFKFIGNFYMGLQLPAVSNLLVALGQTLAVLGTFVLWQTKSHSLLLISVVNTASPLIVYLISYPVTFYGKHASLRPNFSLVNKSLVKSLFSMGGKFFVLQISAILLFMSLNIIISKCFSPKMVTPYQIAYRYFCLVQMVFFIVSSPYWTATTDAYRKHDIAWIVKSGKTLDKIIVAMFVLVVIMIIAANFVYKIWIGKEIEVPTPMTILVAVYILILSVSTRYSVILNGMGKLELQLATTFIAAVVFVPTAVSIGYCMHNINYLLIFMCLVNVPGMILNRMQYHKVLNGTAKGVWAR